MNMRQHKKGLPKISPGNRRTNQETRTTPMSMSSPLSMEEITRKYGKESWLILAILIFQTMEVIGLVWARNNFYFFLFFVFLFHLLFFFVFPLSVINSFIHWIIIDHRDTVLGSMETKMNDSWCQWKRRVKKLAENSTFRKLRSWHPVPSLHGK